MSDLDKIDARILESLAKGGGELFYPYSSLEADTGFDRKTLKPHIDKLKSAGLVLYARGLMNDDGEVAGSGFGIDYHKNTEIWDIIDRHSDPLDKIFEDLDEFDRLSEDIKNKAKAKINANLLQTLLELPAMQEESETDYDAEAGEGDYDREAQIRNELRQRIIAEAKKELG